MGYCIEKEEGRINIKKENMKPLLQMLSDYFKSGNELRWFDEFNIDDVNLESFDLKHYDENDDERMSISQVFGEYLRYGLTQDNEYYTIVDFYGEKLGDDDIFFKLIAPYCEDGYIQFLGEDGDRFRYVIKNGEFEEKYATLSWD